MRLGSTKQANKSSNKLRLGSTRFAERELKIMIIIFTKNGDSFFHRPFAFGCRPKAIWRLSNLKQTFSDQRCPDPTRYRYIIEFLLRRSTESRHQYAAICGWRMVSQLLEKGLPVIETGSLGL